MRIIELRILISKTFLEQILLLEFPLDETLLRDDVGSGRGNAAVIVLLRHEYVAVVAPQS